VLKKIHGPFAEELLSQKPEPQQPAQQAEWLRFAFSA
jgi:hypothetical protein